MTRRILLPPSAAFVLVAVYLAAESFGFQGLAATEPRTVSEAAATGHAARALQLIAEGQDPNQPQHVASGLLDSGEYELRPLEAAILGRHLEMVRLLQRSGAARFEMARAICFARARLPEVLPDLNAAPAASPDGPTEIAAAISMCTQAQ
jgi:hypothetical protein